MLATKEDTLRYSVWRNCLVYGLSLRLGISTDCEIDKDLASKVLAQQIDILCSYLRFKKKCKSGWGIHSFWFMLDFQNKMTPVQLCMIELIEQLFGRRIFDHVLFIIPGSGKSAAGLDMSTLIDSLQKKIAKMTSCQVTNIKIRNVVTEVMSTDRHGNNMVKSALLILSDIATQTYRDPAPFEPPGMECHEGKKVIKTLIAKYGLSTQEQNHCISSIYSMIPN